MVLSPTQSQMILTSKGLLLDQNQNQMTVMVILEVLKWLELMLDQKTPEQCQILWTVRHSAKMVNMYFPESRPGDLYKV